MKLILRKNDSATSLLLFIYNNYISKTGKDSMSLSALLEILKVFGKNETAIRMSLSRAAKAGLLVNSRIENEVVYTLTAEGKQAIQYWNYGVIQFFKRYELRNGTWNNQWYFINVDFGDKSKEIKAEYIDKLQQMGFAQINTNTWISPFYQSKEVLELSEKYGLENSIFEIYGEMKIHNDTDKFWDNIYGIEKLRKEYIEFVNIYNDKLEEIRRLCKEESFIENGLAFPILHELGFSFFKIAVDDAVLPRDILAEWEGDKATLIMKELRELLLGATYQYLEKFN